jgi:hypothetical protein
LLKKILCQKSTSPSKLLKLVFASLGLAIVEASQHVAFGYYEPPFSQIISSRWIYTAGMVLILIAPFIGQGLVRVIAMAMLGGAVEDLLYWLLVWHPPYSWAPYYIVIHHVPIIPLLLVITALMMLLLLCRYPLDIK